jgi:outer membrane protein assembly factor BamB
MAGGIVLSGTLDRFIRAFDDTSGKLLWEARLGDVPSSAPMTYSVNGKQYIAVVASNGGAQALTFPPLVPEIQNPAGRTAGIWVFALPGNGTAGGNTSQAVATGSLFIEI